MTPPEFAANDWPALGDVAAMVFTFALLLAWLAALGVAWVHWTVRSPLESAVLVALALGVVAMLVGFVRAIHRHRQRMVVLATRGAWWPAEVTEISRGFDPRGIEVGVPYRWIVTAQATGPDGQRAEVKSAPVRRLRDVRDLMGAQVWARVDPRDPSCHVVVARRRREGRLGSAQTRKGPAAL